MGRLAVAPAAGVSGSERDHTPGRTMAQYGKRSAAGARKPASGAAWGNVLDKIR